MLDRLFICHLFYVDQLENCKDIYIYKYKKND